MTPLLLVPGETNSMLERSHRILDLQSRQVSDLLPHNVVIRLLTNTMSRRVREGERKTAPTLESRGQVVDDP